MSKSSLVIAVVVLVAGLSYLAWRGATSGNWSGLLGTLVGPLAGLVVALVATRLARRRRPDCADA
jgi:uncharacterized YccA/Bax inhibitor family protein